MSHNHIVSQIKKPKVVNHQMFIQRANEIHKGKYTYNHTIWCKSSEKVIITCPEHGDFEQTPNSHLSGHGCKKCATSQNVINQSMSLYEFIKKCEILHPNKLNFSKTRYVNNKTPCIFICKECNMEFERIPNQMLSKEKGHGCSQCNGGVRSDINEFIKKAKKVHGNDKFNYDNVIYVNAHTKVKIQCAKKHIFEQSPYHHLNGDGCPYCRGKYRTKEEFQELSNQRYPTKKFEVVGVFSNMSTLVKLKCPYGHVFDVLPQVHINRNSQGGCIKCAHSAASERMKYSQNEWIIMAKEVHNAEYIYNKVVYINSQTDIIITCKKHGEFTQKPSSHLMGAGCPKCAIDKIVASKLLTVEDFQIKIKMAEQKHQGKYEYSGICRDEGYLRIDVICNKHGAFRQRLDHHLNGHGCYKCSSCVSKMQIEWLEFRSINDGFIQHALNGGEFQIPSRKMKADGWNFQTNTIYEFQGDIWHGNPKIFDANDTNPVTGELYGLLYKRTQEKNEYLQTQGYAVIEMWENDWIRAKNALIQIQRKWRQRNI